MELIIIFLTIIVVGLFIMYILNKISNKSLKKQITKEEYKNIMFDIKKDNKVKIFSIISIFLSVIFFEYILIFLIFPWIFVIFMLVGTFFLILMSSSGYELIVALIEIFNLDIALTLFFIAASSILLRGIYINSKAKEKLNKFITIKKTKNIT